MCDCKNGSSCEGIILDANLVNIKGFIEEADEACIILGDYVLFLRIVYLDALHVRNIIGKLFVSYPLKRDFINLKNPIGFTDHDLFLISAKCHAQSSLSKINLFWHILCIHIVKL